MRERFLADITHELKTPLSVIILNIDLLRKTCSTIKRGKAKKSMDLMWRNSLRLSNSIESIMNLTKMDSVDVQTKNFSLREVIYSVIEDYSPIAETKDLILMVRGPNIRVRGDPHILSMALGNLVSNALKFTEKGEVSVSWKKNNGFVEISVSDTGKGISKKNQEKVFRKFFKEDYNFPGSGIGLTISIGLIKKMGGNVRFKSTPGKGSTFTIIIPKEVKT